jgi:photosystem II stability/assembly factor-like uncharacterized protein
MAEQDANLQWHPTCAPKRRRHDDIWFVDQQIGWAVNSAGQILKTIDGGARWDLQRLPEDTSVYWRCIGFATPERGWAGGFPDPETPSGRLYATTDGGDNWKSIDADLPDDAPSAICGLSVVDKQVVYASGTNYPDLPAAMVKTTDGGATWTSLDVTWTDSNIAAHPSLLVDTYFTTPERGWVVGGKATVVPNTIDPALLRSDVKPVVLFTADGGTTWVNQVADLAGEFPSHRIADGRVSHVGEWGWKIQFLTDQVGFVSLENFYDGAILTTTDGGETWQRRVVSDPQRNANLEGIGFVDAQHGWVGGWGRADARAGYSSETRDGGTTWRDANDIGKFLNRFRFFGDPVTVGYAAGDTVYKYSAEPVVCPEAEAALAAPQLLDDATPVEVNRPIEIGFTTPPGARRLTINVWDRFGKPVRRLVDEADPASGHRSVTWDFRSDAGAPLPNGSYIVRVTIDGQAESRIVLKTQS